MDTARGDKAYIRVEKGNAWDETGALPVFSPAPLAAARPARSEQLPACLDSSSSSGNNSA